MSYVDMYFFPDLSAAAKYHVVVVANHRRASFLSSLKDVKPFIVIYVEVVWEAIACPSFH